MANPSPIAVRGLRKAYGSFVALRDIDLDVEAGEFLTLLGPSGSGKTTLLMALAGFSRPDAGSIRIAGQEMMLVPPHRRNIGLVFQNYALFPHMSVGENIAFPLRYRRVSRADAQARVKRALDLVRLPGFEHRRIHELSGGQRQRVAVARAAVFEPSMLLMDEPLSALDKKLREDMQVELKQLHERLGTTTIYVTHDQREALTMSSRIAVMNHGEILQIGRPQEVYERPRNFFVADFMGETELIPVVRAPDGGALLDGVRLKLPAITAMPRDECYLLVRPEKVEIVRDPSAVDSLNLLHGHVTDLLYQGEQVTVSFALKGGQRISVRRGTGRKTMQTLPSAGEKVTLGIHVDDTVLIARD